MQRSTFTDDDLKRLRNEYDEMGVDKIEALIARLEAAEKICLILWGQLSSEEISDHEELKAWRKAAGKNKEAL